MNDVIALLALLAVVWFVGMLVVGACRLGSRDVQAQDNLQRIADAVDPEGRRR